MVKGKSDGHSDGSRIWKNAAVHLALPWFYYSRDEFPLNDEENNNVVIYGNERDEIREFFSLEEKKLRRSV